MYEEFRLPPSPFEVEHARLGLGFLAPSPYGRPGPLRPRTYAKPRDFLTPKERERIGQSDPSVVSADDLSEKYGIAISYVYALRQEHRSAQLSGLAKFPKALESVA